MKSGLRLRVILGFTFLAVGLSACVFPEKNDPFERLPEEQTEILEGVVYPFSVSVSTNATHRLEADNKLVAYLASHIVRLEDFEGREVEVEGVKRDEKMREIFWVERIKVLDTDIEIEEKTEERFSTRNFAFVYPSHWKYSQAPDGTAHFTDKNDVAQRVFLTFEVQEMKRADQHVDPDVMIANLAGTKKLTTDDTGKERQEIILFSNLMDKKYRFVFTAQYEDFDRKKDFYKLLNSFIEGEENVAAILEEDKKVEAEREAQILALEEQKRLAEETSLAQEQESSEETEEPSMIEKLFGNDEPETPMSEVPETDKTNKTPEELIAEVEAGTDTGTESTQTEVDLGGEYTNVIDARAFYYESSYYRFSMKVPFGFWFQNFGPSNDKLAEIGFSDAGALTGRDSAQFRLLILGTTTPISSLTEQQDESGNLVIDFPRNDTSHFRFIGKAQYRDTMRSIANSMQLF